LPGPPAYCEVQSTVNRDRADADNHVIWTRFGGWNLRDVKYGGRTKSFQDDGFH
jgi:hypothetical protein